MQKKKLIHDSSGLGAAAAAFAQDPGSPRIQLLADVSDPVAPQMVNGLLGFIGAVSLVVATVALESAVERKRIQ